MFSFFTYADPDYARALYSYPIPIAGVPPACHVLCIRTFCCWSASVWRSRIHILPTYQAWLGYYKAKMKALRWDPPRLVATANSFAAGALGLDEVPTLQASQ